MDNNTKSISSLTKELTDTFLSAFKTGIESFQTAGDALAKLVDSNPNALEKIQAEHCIPMAVLRQFLNIGRKRLLPQLFIAPGFVKTLPIEDQQRLVDGKVEALVLRADGAVDTVKVDAMAPDNKLVRQVVGPRGIRTLAEQRAALLAEANVIAARKEAVKIGKVEPMPYKVVGKKIVIGNHEFTATDLLNMLKLIS